MKFYFYLLMLISLVLIWISILNFDAYDETFKQSNDKLDEFRVQHQKIIEGELKQKFVISLPHRTHGYGNKLYNILTALTVSILTDSACLIEIDQIEDLIESPLKSSFQNLGHLKFSILQNGTFTKRLNLQTIQELETVEEWKYYKNISILINTSIPENFTLLKYTNNAAYFFEICSNPKYYDKLVYYDLVSLSSVNEAKHSINSKLSNDEKLNKLLQIGFEVGGNLLRRMWKPKIDITNLVNLFVVENFKNYFVIGIHIRDGYTELSDIDKFVKCAVQIENSILKFTKWLIVSDYDEMLLEIKSKYPHKILTIEGKASHIGFSPYGLKKTLIDHEILTRCHEIITTSGSTFGFLASIKQLKLPYYVNGKREQDESCKRMSLSRPSKTPSNAAVF